jgi:hypothetical protein
LHTYHSLFFFPQGVSPAAPPLPALGVPEWRFFDVPRGDFFRPSLLPFAGILPSLEKKICGRNEVREMKWGHPLFLYFAFASLDHILFQLIT